MSNHRTLAKIGKALGVLALPVSLVCVAPMEAQMPLAITELMSDAATNCAGVCVGATDFLHPDFWELTNFGTNAIELTGYNFWTDGSKKNLQRIDDEIWISAGESVIFVRDPDTDCFGTPADFRAWWGIASDVQVYFYLRGGLGFDDLGEELWLWDADTNLVDYVVYGEARHGEGVTFTYNPLDGRFGEFSQAGECGAFVAAECNDVGSPGVAPCGAVGLRMREQPLSQTVDAGTDVTFSVQADGLPRPRVRWYFSQTPRASDDSAEGGLLTPINYAGSGLAWKPVSKVTDLLIRSAAPSDAGEYYAVLDNGLERMTSAVVTLTINIDPAPPEIVSPPEARRWPLLYGQPWTNQVVAPGQTAELGVLVRGYPLPTFQWSWASGGSDVFMELDGETNSVLVIGDAQLADAGTYQVTVSNDSGSTNAVASLTVDPLPRLRITEAMSRSTAPTVHQDWWELTNLGENPVPLYGYRWDDETYSLSSGVIITNAVTIQPGESVILFNGRSEEDFVSWWGASNLPPNAQILLYSANGLSERNDAIYIWNPTATNKLDFVNRVDVDVAENSGNSFWYDTEICIDSEPGVVSVLGEGETFVAAEGGDVGSPGWTAWTRPFLTEVRREGVDVRLEWRAPRGSLNRLEYALSLPAVNWTSLGSYRANEGLGMRIDRGIGDNSRRFYRLVLEALGDWPCPDE